MPTLQDLPLECIERILSFLPKRKELLLSLLTLCHHMHTAAKRQLFNSVYLNSRSQLSSLLAAFSKPEQGLAAAIRSLHIVVAPESNTQVVPGPARLRYAQITSQEEPEGIPLDVALVILAQTVNLTSISLECSGFTTRPDTVFAPYLVQMKRITKFAIECKNESYMDLQFLQADLLPVWTNLSKLTLVNFKSSNVTPPNQHAPPPQNSNNNTATVTFPTTMHLREISLTQGTISDSEFIAMLDASSPTLSILRLVSVKSLSMVGFRSGLSVVGGIDTLEIRDCTFTDQTPQPVQNPHNQHGQAGAMAWGGQRFRPVPLQQQAPGVFVIPFPPPPQQQGQGQGQGQAAPVTTTTATGQAAPANAPAFPGQGQVLGNRLGQLPGAQPALQAIGQAQNLLGQGGGGVVQAGQGGGGQPLGGQAPRLFFRRPLPPGWNPPGGFQGQGQPPGPPPPPVLNPADIVFPGTSLITLCPFLHSLYLASDSLLHPSSLNSLFQYLPLQHVEFDFICPVWPIEDLTHAIERVAEGSGSLESVSVGKKMKWVDGGNGLARIAEGRDVNVFWL